MNAEQSSSLALTATHHHAIPTLTANTVDHVIGIFLGDDSAHRRLKRSTDKFLTGFPEKQAWEHVTATIKQAIGVTSSPQEEPIEAILTALEGHLASFLRLDHIDDASEESQQVIYSTLYPCLALIEDGDKQIFQIERSPHHTFFYFPRFVSLALTALQSAATVGIFDPRSGVISQFVYQMEAYLYRAMDSAVRARQQDIQLQLGGPTSNVGYVYDARYRESLTEWVEFNEYAGSLEEALVSLRTQIADTYLHAIHFKMGYGVSQKVGNFAVSSYEQVRLVVGGVHPDPTQNVTRSASKLILDSAWERYYPGKQQEGKKGLRFTPDIAEDLAKAVPVNFGRAFLSKSKWLSSAYIGAAYSTGFAVLLLPLYALLFPDPDAITWDKVIDEIRKQIKEELENKERHEIEQKLKHVAEDYKLRYEIVGQKGSQSLSEWESLLSSSSEMQGMLYNPHGDVFYKAHPFFEPFFGMRVNILHSALGVAPGSATIQGLIEKFYNETYLYLEKLIDAAWNNIEGQKIRVNYWRVGNIFQQDWYYVVMDERHNLMLSVPLLNKEDGVRNACRYLDERIRYFVTLSTGLRTLCEVYDAAVSTHNAIVGKNGKNFPSAIEKLFEGKFQAKYQVVIDRYKWAKDDSAADIKYYCDYFSWGPSTEDWYIHVFDEYNYKGNSLKLGVGDYKDLSLLTDGGFKGRIRSAKINQGLSIGVYTKNLFDGDKQVAEAYFPASEEQQKWIPSISVNGKDVKSARVRVDFERSFAMRPARLATADSDVLFNSEIVPRW